MKYILIVQVCSVLHGYCYPPLTDRVIFDSWSSCVIAGSEKVIKLVNKDVDVWEKEKLMVKYLCNEKPEPKNNTYESPA